MSIERLRHDCVEAQEMLESAVDYTAEEYSVIAFDADSMVNVVLSLPRSD